MAGTGARAYTFPMSRRGESIARPTHPPPRRVSVPDAPALVAGTGGATAISPEGEVRTLSHADAAAFVKSQPPIVCHIPATARRLGCPPFAAFDVLELFAFVRPVSFLLPTPRGVAAALGLAAPESHDDEAKTLGQAAAALLDELAAGLPKEREDAVPIARAMAAAEWAWGPLVLAALGIEGGDLGKGMAAAGLKVWERLPEWSERGPETPPGNIGVEPAEARARLAALLGDGAEARPQQADYASAVTAAFAPREVRGEPRFVLAEAGTGVGKTLGYIAPASLWAEKNQAPVWISTFTRNLQRQIDTELDRLFPDAVRKESKVVVRKGRENYLCLLNLEEAVNRQAGQDREAIALGLMARWAASTRDGDMIGGDFPAWLSHLLGYARTLGLADRRGECVYSACRHYHKCFIEKTVRRARRAEIVVANHALVMTQAALGGLDDAYLPMRYVFDEGHHVFAAADQAFSARLSGRETAELRRWLLGAEDGGGRQRGRARGLKRRIGDLTVTDDAAEAALEELLRAARKLPGENWLRRLAADNPRGPAEAFLGRVRQQVLARARSADGPYGLETEKAPPVDGLIDAAGALDAALAALAGPLAALGGRLGAMIDEGADKLDTPTRLRIEGGLRSLERRAKIPIIGWRSMIETLAGQTPEEFVDWFAIDREAGRETDVGMHRHWVDPTVPFVRHVAEPAHGIVVTSASLRDGTGDNEADWRAAEIATGALHLAGRPVRAWVPSPFDYARQTRIFVVTDVARDDADKVAAAYRVLFAASGGGGLGLFTSISRLRAVHERIAPALEKAGVTLYAQHVDELDTTTLVDIFRAEEDACLLGTDAVRDGVDVPGKSLRLIVFDRVPWPRPDILHRARRAAFGGRGYDEMITRLRLKQAYGRLVRRADDRGVFVMLDRAMPSRFNGAFPEDAVVERTGLAATAARIAEFLGSEEA